MVIFAITVCGIGSLTMVFIACELGQRLSNSFTNVENDLNQVDWYLLPVDQQRIWQMLITYAQEPIAVKFFGSVSCSRLQFRKVSNCKRILKI